jgi:release factor glutamine methyltransferase
MSRVKNSIHQLEKSLHKISGPCSLYEAETILQHVLRCSRSELYTTLISSEMSDEKRSTIDGILQRRLAEEPLAYILVSLYFYSKNILLTKDVLIPRPETEVLVETVLKQEHTGPVEFADICTGSGAIAAVLLAERPAWNAVASVPMLRYACCIQNKHTHV